MYALENIKKFLRDNADKVGNRAPDILARAEELSQDGVLWGSTIEEIMGGDPDLTAAFREVAVRDLEHVEIGLTAIRAAPLSDD